MQAFANPTDLAWSGVWRNVFLCKTPSFDGVWRIIFFILWLLLLLLLLLIIIIIIIIIIVVVVGTYFCHNCQLFWIMADSIANFWYCVRCYDHIYSHFDVVVAGVVATVVQFGLFDGWWYCHCGRWKSHISYDWCYCPFGMEITILYNSWCFTVADVTVTLCG